MAVLKRTACGVPGRPDFERLQRPGTFLTFRDDDVCFTAERSAADSGTAKNFVPGSEWIVPGIGPADAPASRGEAGQFRIQLSADPDLILIHNAIWWTPRRMMAMLGVTCLAALASFAWIMSLRRRVRYQTEEIKDRLEHEAALERCYRDLVQNAHDIIVSCDLSGYLYEVNAAGQALIGYSAAEFHDRTLFDLAVPVERDAIEQIFERFRAGESLARLEVDIVTRYGSIVMLESVRDTQACYEAAAAGLLSSVLADGIHRVKGGKMLDSRIGNWLTANEAGAPSLLAILLGQLYPSHPI